VLDANRLAVLVEVAHAGSIAGAAGRLSLTPSAVSQQLAKLERELGCRLLHREPRGVTLTPIGQLLLVHAETVVGELRVAQQSVQALLGEQPAQMVVGTFASAGEVFVPAALAGFRHQHPAVALRLLDIEPPDGYGLVGSHDLDLLITHRYPGVTLPDPRGLRRRLLTADPLRLVLPAGHPKARARRLTLSRLTDEDWISGGDGVPNRVHLNQLADTAGTRLRVAYETRDYHVTLALIKASLGIALVPASVLWHADRTRLAVRSLHDTTPARDIYLVHHKHPTRLVADMIGELAQHTPTPVSNDSDRR
jgi:DNA-binding transcriptional LysR family regulator